MKNEDKKTRKPKSIIDILEFGFLTSEEKKLVKSNVINTTYYKNSVICEQGGKIDYLYFLQSGLVKFYKTDNHGVGRLHFICYDNIYVNLLASLKNYDNDNQHEYTMIAAEDCEIYAVKYSIIQDLIRRNGLFGYDLITKLSEGSMFILNRYINIYRRQVKERIAFIIIFFKHYYNDDYFVLPISRVELAELLDVARENIIRTLQEFNNDGIIELKNKKLLIKNLDILIKLNKMGENK